MNYTLPPIQKVYNKSSIEPYFDRAWGTIIRGAHRLQILLNDYLPQGILNTPCILVSGSNGKGTTCAFIESIIREHGFKTGLYTSPHLIHPTERMRINGIVIEEKILEKYLNIIVEASKIYLPDASFFELTTATAFLIFLEQKVEFIVCEVGLGGHYDSTNCLAPLASVLTSVSLEHTKFLGDTLFQIAADKSFISRRNKPFIISQTICKEALAGVEETIQITGAKLVHSSNELPELFEKQLHSIKYSEHHSLFHFAKLNLINLRTALCAVYQLQIQLQTQYQKTIHIDQSSLEKSILKTEWPGRFDIRKINGRNVIFDASHNPDGFQYFLKEYQKSQFSKRKCVLIFASLSDKDWKTTLSFLPEIAKSIIFTQIPSNRTELAGDLTQYLQKQKETEDHFKTNYKNIFCSTIPNFDLALETAMDEMPDLPLVITGSIAFIGSAMKRFGLNFHRGAE